MGKNEEDQLRLLRWLRDQELSTGEPCNDEELAVGLGWPLDKARRFVFSLRKEGDVNARDRFIEGERRFYRIHPAGQGLRRLSQVPREGAMSIIHVGDRAKVRDSTFQAASDEASNTASHAKSTAVRVEARGGLLALLRRLLGL